MNMLIIGLLPFVIYASIVVIGMAVSLAFGPLHPPDDRPRPINREKFATLECGNLTPERPCPINPSLGLLFGQLAILPKKSVGA